MSERGRFEGQAKVLVFDLEQVTAIASASRSEVFWTFSAEEPMAISDVAKILGKSAATVNYHTNALSKVKLLIAVGERQRVARREKLYVRAAEAFYSKPHPMGDEYRRQVARGFEAILRSTARDRAALHRAISQAPEFLGLSDFNIASIRLRPDDIRELIKKVQDLHLEYRAKADADGIRVNLTSVLVPSMGEIRASYQRATGSDLPEDAEDDGN